jgi:hypothetical protein
MGLYPQTSSPPVRTCTPKIKSKTRVSPRPDHALNDYALSIVTVRQATGEPLRIQERPGQSHFHRRSPRCCRLQRPPRTLHPLGPYSRFMSRALWCSWGGVEVSYERGTPVGHTREPKTSWRPCEIDAVRESVRAQARPWPSHLHLQAKRLNIFRPSD